MPITLGEQTLDRCPLRSYFENPQAYNELFERYKWLNEGILLDPGLLPDQTYAFNEYVRVISRATEEASDMREARRQRQEKIKAQADKFVGQRRGLPGRRR